jgi:hypothetical protein
MIESTISSNHHYYLFFFESSKLKTLSSVTSIFGNNNSYEIISFGKNKEMEFCHLQLEIDKLFGSESVMALNISKTKKGGPFYWYDFYIGKIDLNEKKFFFICYPYNRLGRYLVDIFHSKSVQTIFYKPKLEDVLDYMKNRNNKGLSQVEKSGFNADITKYSARITEDDNRANRINIIGENPLKSKTFEILSSEKDIGIETISLKLRCSQVNVGDIELSFDSIGNYRFWLKKYAQKTSIPVIPFGFKFLMEIAPLQQSDFISINTFLENE